MRQHLFCVMFICILCVNTARSFADTVQIETDKLVALNGTLASLKQRQTELSENLARIHNKIDKNTAASPGADEKLREASEKLFEAEQVQKDTPTNASDLLVEQAKLKVQ